MGYILSTAISVSLILIDPTFLSSAVERNIEDQFIDYFGSKFHLQIELVSGMCNSILFFTKLCFHRYVKFFR